jgi:hypothetical protein
MKQGREASGVSGSGGPRKGFERAGTRKPEPSRGARTLRTAPAGVVAYLRPPQRREPGWCQQGAPDVVAFVGTRTSREADPGRSRTWAAQAVQGGERLGRASCGSCSQGRAELQERISQELVLAGLARRGRPRGRSERRGGSAGSQEGATRRAEQTSVGDGDSREWSGAWATTSRAPW